MTTQADFDAFVEAQGGVRSLALRDLKAWWTTVEHLSPSQIQSAAAEFAPILAGVYGEVSATVAADYYDLARELAPKARGRFVASLAPSEAAARTSRQVGWATAPLFEGDSLGALDRLSGVVDAASLQDGRNTLMRNSGMDPAKPRYARIPVGKTCAWCLMLASRGAVYRSAATAGAAQEYHKRCDCEPHPSWDHGKDLPPSYDEGGLYDLYDRAKKEAGGSGDPKDITAAIRRLDEGGLVSDGVGKRAAPRPSARRQRRTQTP